MISVVYELEALGAATRLTQRDDASLGAPRLLRPFVRSGIGRDIAHQLATLKRVLEDRD